MSLGEQQRNSLCPVRLAAASSPVWPAGSLLHQDGSPLTRFQFGAMLKCCLHQLGLNCKEYGMHSFALVLQLTWRLVVIQRLPSRISAGGNPKPFDLMSDWKRSDFAPVALVFLFVLVPIAPAKPKNVSSKGALLQLAIKQVHGRFFDFLLQLG